MADVTERANAISRQLVIALRKMVMPLRRRVTNHDAHIRHLLAMVKELKRDRDAQAEEIRRLKQQITWEKKHEGLE